MPKAGGSLPCSLHNRDHFRHPTQDIVVAWAMATAHRECQSRVAKRGKKGVKTSVFVWKVKHASYSKLWKRKNVFFGIYESTASACVTFGFC